MVGPHDTLEALIKGQVEELLISSSLRELQPVGALAPSTASDSLEAVLRNRCWKRSPPASPRQAGTETIRLADELITKAAQTGARITFVEDAELLTDYGGVAAILRFAI